MWLEYTVGCDEDGTARRAARANRRRHRRLRERRRQGARAGRRPRLRRIQGPERRRRGEGRLHEQPAVRRHARIRRQPVELRRRGHARPARRRVGIDGWEIRWRNALDTGDRSAPARGSARASASRRRCSPCATRTGTRATPGSPAASRTRASATASRSTAARSYGRSATVSYAAPLLDGDGPGRAHRPAPARLRGARASRRSEWTSSSTRSASSTPA